jgi:hypothetical protein
MRTVGDGGGQRGTGRRCGIADAHLRGGRPVWNPGIVAGERRRRGRKAGSVLGHGREVGGRLDQRVDDLPGAGVAVAGWKQRVDVTPA